MDKDLKSNAKKALKAEPIEAKKVGKIVSGRVKTKKPSEAKKLARTFISDDIGKVKEFVLMDVLIPSIKQAISDIVRNGIDMILYGEAGRSKKSNLPGSKIGYTSYNSMTSGTYRNNNLRQVASRSTYSYDDIILETRGEAEQVLAQMEESIVHYGLVRVSDLYDFVGVTGSYTDNNYGWTDIRSARVDRVRDGYMIKLPRALPMD